MSLDLKPTREVFARYRVIAAYLFGSQVSGTRTPLSDVDIAVLLEQGRAAPDVIHAALISDLMLALRRSDIGVVILLPPRRPLGSGPNRPACPR
jgi:predicted nucleotidyltransferase